MNMHLSKYLKNMTSNKKIVSIMIFIVVFFLFIFIIKLVAHKDTQQYSVNLFYMDTYINVKVYTNDADKAKKALDEVEKIYENYHQLSDRYNAYENINNIYYINNNQDSALSIELDPKLCQLLIYGLTWYGNSDGLLNINIGQAVDVWKKYRDNKTGIPTLEELDIQAAINIENIKLSANCEIENTKPNIDLGALAKGYATEVAGEYLSASGIKKFIINAGGNTLVGDHYANDKYKIGIKDPTDSSQIFTKVLGNNIAVVTSGSYERFYEYEGNIYHHILNPNTLMPPNYFKSVTIISPSSALAEALSTTLFLMPIDAGQAFIQNYEAEAIWYDIDNNIIKSEGFAKYEQK